MNEIFYWTYAIKLEITCTCSSGDIGFNILVVVKGVSFGLWLLNLFALELHVLALKSLRHEYYAKYKKL